MQIFVESGANKEELLALNRCRLYLQAYFLSDLVDGSGSYLLDDAWHGHLQEVPHKTDSWPKQGKPPMKDWLIWQFFLKRCFLGRGRKFKNTLGSWTQMDENWPWYYSPLENNLYKCSSQGWISFPGIVKRSGRPCFSTKGVPTKLVPTLHRATVYKKGDRFICSGHGPISVKTDKKFDSLSSLFLSLPPGERWCINHIQMEDEGLTLATAIKNHNAIAVSDGSFKDGYGTAAWVLEGIDNRGRIVGQVIIAP